MQSLTYQRFTAIEKQGYCPAHPNAAPARSHELERIVAPRSTVAYDAIVRVGFAQFVECRQFGEIQADLARRHGVSGPG